MLKIIFWIVVVATIVVASSSLFAQSSNADKIKRSVQKIGVKADLTVVRSDGQWFYGSVEQIDDTSFTIYEIEQKTRINFSYAQVSKVFKGYGDGAAIHRDRNGHRIPPSRHHLGWAIAGAALVIVVLVGAFGLRD